MIALIVDGVRKMAKLRRPSGTILPQRKTKLREKVEGIRGDNGGCGVESNWVHISSKAKSENVWYLHCD